MERDTPNRRVGIDQRAQSVFDFSIGVSLFLVVVIGVLAFIPMTFTPLSDNSGVTSSDRVVAERTADYLVGSGFGDEESGLNPDCVVAFFDDQANCGFASGNALTEDVGISATQPLNVTIESDELERTDAELETLCWDDSANGVVIVDTADCDPDNPSDNDVIWSAGPSAAKNEQFVTATRTTRLGDLEVYIYVRTW